MAEMYVIIYLRGHDDEVPHWCLHTVDDNKNELIFEALGSSDHSFHFHSRAVDMDTSQSKKEKVYIGRIEADIWSDTPQLLEGVPMSTQKGWNCQSWVKEAIQELKDKGYLEEDDTGLSYVEEKFQEKIGTYI